MALGSINDPEKTKQQKDKKKEVRRFLMILQKIKKRFVHVYKDWTNFQKTETH